MSIDYENTPTLLGYSVGEMGVKIGGGFLGYGGIAIHEPTEEEFHQILVDPTLLSEETETEEKGPKGIVFSYSEVGTVTIGGLLKWTNWELNRAPRKYVSIEATGKVRVEIFDTEEMREVIANRAGLLESIGMKFLG